MIVFVFKDRIETSYNQIMSTYLPCKKPIVYSIGSFDKEFVISKDEFLKAIKEAEAIWEEPSGKDLFSYTEEVHPSNLAINLIYDSRQEATEKLQKIDTKLDNTRLSYDALKASYEALKVEYGKDKSVFDARLATFQARREKYQNDVDRANAEGGASQEEYARLQEEQSQINNEARTINELQANLNKKIIQVNDMVRELNQLAQSLNLDVKKFNEIGGSNGEEFEEGIYIRDFNGTRINIYQYDNRAKLVRVLAHEFGHALGLLHIEDKEAIMYRLNSGTSQKLTEADLLELNKKCASW